MNLLAIAAFVAAAAALGVAAMYAVRRWASSDEFLTDTTRGSAIFGVIGTAFAVLLAFVMFVAFTGYNEARQSSEQEAATVDQMFLTAGIFANPARDELRGETLCYARAAVADEWPAMADEGESARVDGWRHAFEASLRSVPLEGDLQLAAYRDLLEQRDERSSARRVRLFEAEPAVSTPVWLILVLGGLLTVAFVLLFTDRREAFAVQASLIATVAAMVAASLTLVWFLDHPYEGGSGSVEPEEMERTIGEIEREHPALAPPCDRSGRPNPA
jgi:hypothetical protein